MDKHPEPAKAGHIVCVGVGMTLGAHITPIARSYIESADIVFCNVSNQYVEQWVSGMNPTVHSLQHFYQEGKSRTRTYREMVRVMLDAVRDGLRVVGAFYGHPGVFAWAPHEVIRQARELGYTASMLPGISAEDCLFADLGIDPGQYGCQQLEASQFLLYQRQLDTAGYVILWQIGVVGDISRGKFVTEARYRALLAEQLGHLYPKDHPVILYEAPVLPVDKTRADTLPLSALANANVHQHTTLVIPPHKTMQRDETMWARLVALAQSEDTQ
ncbi:SAM-dependent methyltransferase [Alteromonas sp. CYL-A6]|uniref:SAM-dependent methyltransferase n=1 Tax=Alteromonas nitratireducens TaxID=3390813 RepID=UPI0034BB40BF